MRNRLRAIIVAVCVVVAFCVLLPPDCPAPLIWRKGEGWTYERPGVTTAHTPQEQLKLARELHAKKDYGNALAAYRRVVRRWPLSSAAQDARLGAAECLTALGYYYKAFLEYQQLIEKHPNTEHFDTVLQRQFEIGNLFMAGERQKVWGVRWFPDVARAVEIFERVVKNGPYSKLAPEAQYRIGLTHEKLREYADAVRAYERLLERYPKDPLAELAQFQIGHAYMQEARRSEYDQNAANQAIAAFTEFLVRYPNSEKVSLAQSNLARLKQEQARGLFQIGQFYEKSKNYKAALVYYNEVIEQNPGSSWASAAQQKLAALGPKVAETAAAQ